MNFASSFSSGGFGGGGDVTSSNGGDFRGGGGGGGFVNFVQQQQQQQRQQTVGNFDEDRVPPEIASAYREAEARGLPKGWTCTIDKRNRRKWTAPNGGRSCDSIPKALAISVEMNLLPPDTVIEPGKRKRSLTPKAREREQKKKKMKKEKKEKRKKDKDGKILKKSDTKTTAERSKNSSSPTPSLQSKKSQQSNNNNNNNNNKRKKKDDEITNEKERNNNSDDDDDNNNDSDDSDDESSRSSSSSEESGPPPEPMNPEVSLDYPTTIQIQKQYPGLMKSLPTTVHWDAADADGRKIGWKVKIAWTDQDWVDGRIVLFDPHSHKHKIQLDTSPDDNRCGRDYVWVWLRNEQHNIQLATRMVWAHVKGYAWWPALVMESNSPTADTRKEGYVLLEFFGTGEISTLRDTAESVRSFSPDRIDQVVAKHKKKRNAKAYNAACEEFATIRKTRNDAVIQYAKKAIRMVMNNPEQRITRNNNNSVLGKRIQIFRSDVNYPYGDIVVGKVRQYSYIQKKWLVSFEISNKTKIKYGAAWINLNQKEANVKVLDKKSSSFSSNNDDNTTSSDNNINSNITNEDLLPYLFGWEPATKAESETEIDALLKSRCRGCVDCWKSSDIKLTCEVCDGSYHISCIDPPISMEAYQRMTSKDGDSIPPFFVCSRCKPCRGCYRNDIVYGCHPHPTPPTSLTYPSGEVLELCSMCRDAYDDGRFCPNCAHSWDDKKFGIVRKQMELMTGVGRKRKGLGPADVIEDSASELLFGSFSGDEVLPLGAKVDPSFFFPETSQWGYTEVEMLFCDGCKLWVHASCAGILSELEYEKISDGEHPIYSKEFLCRMCCRRRCIDIIDALGKEDRTDLFALPVSDKEAPTYYDLIKNPMDLQTMRYKAANEEYLNYAWIRDLFELMLVNALTFNRHHTEVWREAKRFYQAALDSVFKKLGKGAPPGKYQKEIMQFFQKAEEARKLEEDRVQIDESVEKKDLVAGSLGTLTTKMLPTLREAPPDQPSCLPYREVKLKPVDAFYCCWMDCCFTCGSSGASDTFLHCVDCGEAFHSFCVGAPVHSMELSSAAGWRCPNCKICEISGDVPQDETRMLFCEMCDRAFSLDLLDPPLKKAPPGLWICGQCVDCKSCGNRSEKDGASLRHWSRDPKKCFRCGGCDDLVKDYVLKLKCQICAGLLRKDDCDIVECSECKAKIHTTCDVLANDYICSQECESRSKKSQTSEIHEYLCPRCFKSSPDNKETQEYERSFFEEVAAKTILDGQLLPHDNYSQSELMTKLLDEVDWSTRDQWREEYIAIVRDGVRIYSLAKRLLDDPRYVVQQQGEGSTKHRRCNAQRALRFVTMVKRLGWDTKEICLERTASIVAAAKLAAAWIDVACQSLGVDKRKDVAFYDRILNLLQTPGKAGLYSFPFDRIRRSQAIFEFDEDGVILNVGKGGSVTLSSSNVRLFEHVSNRDLSVTVASPLCGWSEDLATPMGLTEWKDPRECCLCHLCGDLDAGFEDYSEDEDNPDISAGRLLPVHDGYWVHASCALWSSEVWESSDDALVHAVEKARSRGAQLKCFGCGHSGATVGCYKTNCPYNYHFPCAKVCNVVFTHDHQAFCANHKSCAVGIMTNAGPEHMKALMVAPDKKTEKDTAESAESELCSRVGSLVVHSLGTVESKVDGFHSEDYIYPPGYVASRIFWSSRVPRTRTVYVLKVEKASDMEPKFSIVPGDDPAGKIAGDSASTVYAALMERVRKVNSQFFSQRDMYSKLPVIRRTRRKTFGLNGPQFFGFGLNHVRKQLESMSGVEAVVAPLTPSSPKYRFCFVCGSDPSTFVDQILDIQRKRAAERAEQALQNSSGCARTEGIKAVTTSGGSGRITRALVRSAEEEASDLGSNAAITKKGEEKAKADRNLIQTKYHRMKAIPMEQRLVARRSHIHGWGLFTKSDIPKDNPVVEYMGETIRQQIADKREKEYELSGEGSCYMFRLDLHRIVDATKIGSMARFMNHSCQPNAYAKIITVDTDLGPDKKIVVFAIRDIAAGEEITYDYKFPVEDGSLRCTCGAPNCIGRLN